MKNLNIIALEDNGVRFWGFEELSGCFTAHFTMYGLFLRAAHEGMPGVYHKRDGFCADQEFVDKLKERQFTYGTMLKSSGGTYIGVIKPLFETSLEEMVKEYHKRAAELEAGVWEGME